MFVDSVELTLSSGKGGAGAVSFRREKHVLLGGPDGGDGGRGGNVYIKVDNNTHTLSHFRGKKHLKAKNGQNGSIRNRYGKKGEDLEIKVPPGTQILDFETKELLADLDKNEMRIEFLKGGIGGLGNSHFKSSTNQRPDFAQSGKEGESRKVRLELKLIADVGLVGYPNVGKSTLISSISNARPEVANYEFTTLTPKLGVVKVDDLNEFIMADIPGIIDGAWEGKGLGLKFLKHIERTKCLLLLLDLANYRSLKEQYDGLKRELEKFSSLLSNRPYAIMLSRSDTLSEKEANKKAQDFIKLLKLDKNMQDIKNYDKEKAFFVMSVSSVAKTNLQNLIFALWELVKNEKNSD